MALNEQQIQKVRLTISGDGWNHVMKPAILNRAGQALKALTLEPGAERTAQFKGTDFDTSDPVLRAMIRDCEWMSVVWDNEVQVHDRNRALDELEKAGQPS
jgi:type IV secretory pathway ATPase VirB11/archaellum biosynthesis ATPase